jgi:hypothetical protein
MHRLSKSESQRYENVASPKDAAFGWTTHQNAARGIVAQIPAGSLYIHHFTK